MRLLDTYAVNCGAKIDKPFIYTTYFPLPVEKYITFQAQSKFDSKDYSFWQDVITVIYPMLEKLGIKIIQVGLQKERSYNYVVDLKGRTSVNQLAYVIKGSMLHLGPDSLGVHIASSYDVPIVALYSVIQSAVAGPHFGSKDRQILFDAYLRTGNAKPSYSSQEPIKSINLIKVEEIADAVFKLLGLDFSTPFKTVFVGDKYHALPIREFVPNMAVQIQNPEVPVEIRMDIEFNEEVLKHQLSMCKGIIVTDKPIKKEILLMMKPNIAALVYNIKENDHPAFIDEIKDTGIPLTLISYLSDSEIEKKKINYYEHGKINKIQDSPKDTIEELKKDIDLLFYKSNKLMCSSGKLYMGNAARTKEIELTNDFDYQKVIDCPEFWRDIQFTTIIKSSK